MSWQLYTQPLRLPQGRTALNACQVPYPFLDHDSYVDCSTVVEEFTLAELETLLCSDLGRIKGELAADTK